MQIRQLQVACDAVQDRLTLRVATQANEEYRVWFTRRFLRELWPHLVGMLSGHLAARPQSPAEKPAASAPSSSFEQPFKEDNPLFPLGSTPLLASEANLTAAGEGIARVIFREGRERSFTLNLNAELMQALCAMLRKSSEQLSWGLALDYAPAAPADVPTLPADDKKPGLLH
jgi:hypothetical protein